MTKNIYCGNISNSIVILQQLASLFKTKKKHTHIHVHVHIYVNLSTCIVKYTLYRHTSIHTICINCKTFNFNTKKRLKMFFGGRKKGKTCECTCTCTCTCVFSKSSITKIKFNFNRSWRTIFV